MSDNQGWFLVFLIALVLIGIKLTAWVLAGMFIYWLIKTEFKK
jgi:hypothetical protein